MGGLFKLSPLLRQVIELSPQGTKGGTIPSGLHSFKNFLKAFELDQSGQHLPLVDSLMGSSCAVLFDCFLSVCGVLCI